MPSNSWPTNAWYVACTPDEIASGPLGREICGARMVLFRDGDGTARALEDICPHRAAPLSLGFLRDGDLVCGYHGLSVACDGRAASMPGQDVSRFPRTRAFAVLERYGFIWVWPGDAARADPAELHPLPWAEDPAWRYAGGRFYIRCNYRLMVDNLMDLTHETYVHASSIGQREIDEAPVTTEVRGEEVITSRHMPDVMPPPFWQMALRGAGLPADQRVDRWQVCRFNPPSHVMIEVGVALAGRGGYHADADAKASSIVVDFITPETETSHHYFWGMARGFAFEDDALTEAIREGQHRIFSEDLEMLEQQQANLLRFPDRRLLKLDIDAGGVHARAVIARALAKEAQAAVETADRA